MNKTLVTRFVLRCGKGMQQAVVALDKGLLLFPGPTLDSSFCSYGIFNIAEGLRKDQLHRKTPGSVSIERAALMLSYSLRNGCSATGIIAAVAAEKNVDPGFLHYCVLNNDQSVMVRLRSP